MKNMLAPMLMMGLSFPVLLFAADGVLEHVILVIGLLGAFVIGMLVGDRRL